MTDLPALDPAVIDKLKKLEAVAGAGLVKEVVAMFLAPLEERIARLKKAAAARDGAAVQSEAHALRGAAAQVGAAELAHLCMQVEQGAGKDLAQAAKSIDNLEAAAARARAALSEV